MDEVLQPKFRARHGLIPPTQGPSLLAIREWREAQQRAGNRGTLEDYYAAHSLCFSCLGTGVQMIGWSDPVTPLDIQVAKELNLDQLPLYDVCPACSVAGRTNVEVDNGGGSANFLPNNGDLIS